MRSNVDKANPDKVPEGESTSPPKVTEEFNGNDEEPPRSAEQLSSVIPFGDDRQTLDFQIK